MTAETVAGAGHLGPDHIVRGAETMGRLVRDLLLAAHDAALWIRTPRSTDLIALCRGLNRPALGARVLCDGAPAGFPWADAVDVRLTATPGPPAARRQDALVIDGSVVVTMCCPAEAEPYLVVTTGNGLADLVLSLFDTAWSGAEPLRPDAEGGLKLRILHRLADGSKDEAIARSLGISLRTCRRHIAEILLDAQAVSRFQAGYRLGRAGFPGAAR